MGLYYCNYCGNKVSRYGYKAKEAQYHFCNEECRTSFVLDNGPYYRNGKADTITKKCITCGKTIEAKNPIARYCSDCAKLVSRYRSFDRYRKERRFLDLVEYCKSIINNKDRAKSHAEKIIKYLESIRWEEKDVYRFIGLKE